MNEYLIYYREDRIEVVTYDEHKARNMGQPDKIVFADSKYEAVEKETGLEIVGEWEVL